jgi:hypothetical protein
LIKGIHIFSDMVNGPEGPAFMREKGNERRTPIDKKDVEYFLTKPLSMAKKESSHEE